jgi:small-conductance mechanosensitive channel
MSEAQMKRGSSAVKMGTAGAAGAVLIACAACCAPLVASLAAWLGLSGLGMATTGWYWETGAVSAIALVGYLLVRRHKAINFPRSCQTDGRCGCGGDAER